MGKSDRTKGSFPIRSPGDTNNRFMKRGGENYSAISGGKVSRWLYGTAPRSMGDLSGQSPETIVNFLGSYSSECYLEVLSVLDVSLEEMNRYIFR